jgi:squalene-hopene/tetraprenyl-beta-curcumene cyclase
MKDRKMRVIPRRRFLERTVQGISLLSFAVRPLSSQADEPATATEMAGKAVAFLRPRQRADGSWSGDRKEPGITALVVTGMLRSGRVTADDPAVSKGLAYLERFLGPKGGLSEAPHSVYSTSVALMAFHAANKGGRFDRVIKGGQEFLKETQADEGEGKSRTDTQYGGLGYGGENSRPDLSNTAFFVEALRDSGVPADDPALQRALVFVSRCQNLKSEFNDLPGAGKVNDGGFVYMPTSGNTEQPGKAAKGARAKGGRPPAGDGSLRSYAGMTYAGLKSMIYAGLTQDDPRVKAALRYIRDNYTVEENPGQGQRGLYYYYHTFAKAMALLGKPTIVDAKGVEHHWRTDLVAALSKRQEPSGAWVNRDDRFMEGDPNIVTSFALLALASTRSNAVKTD